MVLFWSGNPLIPFCGVHYPKLQLLFTSPLTVHKLLELNALAPDVDVQARQPRVVQEEVNDPRSDTEKIISIYFVKPVLKPKSQKNDIRFFIAIFWKHRGSEYSTFS